MPEQTIITIDVLPMGMINAFLVVSDNGRVLIDAGIPGSEDKIEAKIRRHGVELKDLDLIVITHAHGDHAGAACALRERSGAPIVAHEAELPHYLQEKPMRYCPTGWVGRLLKKTGRLERGYQPFRPDILLQGSEPFNLSAYGVTGSVISTPGHTLGSLSVTLTNKRVVAGDLLTSAILLGGIIRKATPKPPPFEEDPAVVASELEALLDRGFETFYLGHGGPLSAAQVRGYIQQVRSRQPAAVRRH